MEFVPICICPGICPGIWPCIWPICALPAPLTGPGPPMEPFIIMLPPNWPGFPCWVNCCWGYELKQGYKEQNRGDREGSNGSVFLPLYQCIRHTCSVPCHPVASLSCLLTGTWGCLGGVVASQDSEALPCDLASCCCLRLQTRGLPAG